MLALHHATWLLVVAWRCKVKEPGTRCRGSLVPAAQFFCANSKYLGTLVDGLPLIRQGLFKRTILLLEQGDV